MLFIHILMLFFVQALEEEGFTLRRKLNATPEDPVNLTRPCLRGEAIQTPLATGLCS